MDRLSKRNFLIFKGLFYDFKAMGVYFFIPIVVMLLCIANTFNKVFYYNANLEIEYLRELFGVVPVISVSFWVISLFNAIVEPDCKETILSLPYNDYIFGVGRVVRIIVIYLGIFYFSLFWGSLNLGTSLEICDYYLPVVSILFFSALSFFSTIVIKSTIGGYGVTCIFFSLAYMTRGAATGFLYPFQWCNPKPMTDDLVIAIALFISALSLLLLAQIRMKKRQNFL